MAFNLEPYLLQPVDWAVERAIGKSISVVSNTASPFSSPAPLLFCIIIVLSGFCCEVGISSMFRSLLPSLLHEARRRQWP
jgi:hypothetical protein